MEMEIHPYQTSIGGFFADEYIFEIPKYQRNYAWTESEIEDFLKDLKKCYEVRSKGENLPHFFGGIVSVESKIPGSGRKKIHLVDGQQRAATFVMLIANIVSLYSRLEKDLESELASVSDESLKSDLEKCKELIIQRKPELTRKYLQLKTEMEQEVVTTERLTMSQPDTQFFKNMIYGYVEDSDAKRESHRLLKKAFAEIGEFLQNIVEPLASVSDKLDALRRIEEVLNEDFTVIHMITKTKKVAYRLFQVLNDRGTGLTEGDLLRTTTLEILDPPEYNDRQKVIEDAWNDILADPPRQTESFLKWYYSSIMGKRPGTASLLDDFLGAFFPQYTDTIDGAVKSIEDAQKVVDAVCNLQKEVAILRKLVEGEWPYSDQQQITQWHKDRLRLLVVELKHTNCMPLLLAAAAKLVPKKFVEIVQLLELFVFRYKIVCNLHISPLTKVYLEHAKAIRDDYAAYRVGKLRSSLQTLQTTKALDSIFRSNLPIELVYKPGGGNKPLKYFLMTIEHYARWYYDGAQGRPKCKDTARVFDFINTTIEHIYSQNTSSPDPDLDKLVNTLGNLTFLGSDDNDAAGNKSFAQKKPIFEKSSVLINRMIGENDTWNTTTVEARQEELGKMALKVFSI
jgi:hypothetical protein